MHHTGVALAREGYVVICPDAAGFGERNKRGTLDGRNLEHYLFAMQVVDGRSLAWKNIGDMRRAVDYIASRPEVDNTRLGCYGHSMGSTHTWLVGPWEPRLKAHGRQLLPADVRGDGAHRPDPLLPELHSRLARSRRHARRRRRSSRRARCTSTSARRTPAARSRKCTRRWRSSSQAYAARNAADNFSYYIEPGAGHVLSDEMARRMKAHFKKYLA